MKNNLKIAVLGDGGWGTTLAILLSKKGYEVTLWGAFPEYIKYLNRKRENKKFLPGIEIPNSMILTYMIKEATSDKDMVILAVPSQHMREVANRLSRSTGKEIYVSVSKGIESHSLQRMSEIIESALGKVDLAVLSGPTISYEVAREIPTTAVVASKKESVAKKVQEVFITNKFRMYTSADVVGVELGGSLKNIIAIAAGISDGLGYGTNSKAALLSRGLVEITRLG
ncbi:MAG: NAD(P)H-dependent glycerol-3-phosphate dehydrogenase, partial [Candidatus Omnitrophota bacterium]